MKPTKDEMKCRKTLIIQDHKKGLKGNYFFLEYIEKKELHKPITIEVVLTNCITQ